MKTYVVSRMNGTSPKGRVPKLYNYMKDFEVKAGVKNWAIIIVDDGVVVPPAAEADPDIFVIPESNLNNVLTTPQRNAINTRLNQTDLGVTADPGETIRDLFIQIGVALGHSADFIVGF